MARERHYSLRLLEPKDAVGMLEWMNDSDTTKYLLIGGKTYSTCDALRFIEASRDESRNLHRAIVGEEDTYLGTVSLKNIDLEKKEAEYAIALHPKARGSGAAYSATEGILAIAFQELGLMRVYLNVLQENRRAIRFYEKFGFVYREKTTARIKNNSQGLLWYDIKNPTMA